MLPRAPWICHAVEPGRLFSSITHRASTPSGPENVAGPLVLLAPPRVAGPEGTAATRVADAEWPAAFPGPSAAKARPGTAAATTMAGAPPSAPPPGTGPFLPVLANPKGRQYARVPPGGAVSPSVPPRRGHGRRNAAAQRRR